MPNVTQLYFLPGALRETKQSDFSYIQLLKDGLTFLDVTYPSSGGVTIPATEYADNATALAALGAGKLYKSTTYINGSPIILITI